MELYFRLFPGAIWSTKIFEFLSHLLRHIPGKLLIAWDWLPDHRSRMVWDFVRRQHGRLWLEFLPAYAPELNPGGVFVVALEAAQVTQLLPHNFRAAEPSRRQALRRMRKRPTLVIALLAAGRPLSDVTCLYADFQ